MRFKSQIDALLKRTFILCSGLFLLLLACNTPEEISPEKAVVRKKIAVSSKPSQKDPKQPAPQKEVSVATQNTKPAAASVKKASPPNMTTKGKQEKTQMAALSAPEDDRTLETFSPLYDPTGKIDPFTPLLKDKNEAAKKKKVKKRIPRTPLEKMDISQIKLVAVIRSPDGNMALVEEASGKGYIVSIGTYVGLNGGRVTRILKDRLIIEEETENILGKVSVQNRELKLQKSPGEF